MRLLYLCCAVIMRSVVCLGCVAYNFENGFSELFSNGGYCATFPTPWTLDYYNATLITPPDERSNSFIVPASVLSCTSSFVFSASEGGNLEVNVFVASVDSTDHVVVMVYSSEDDTFLGQGIVISLDGTPLMIGYHTIDVFWQPFTGSIDVYAVFMGQASSESLIFIDSFRYIQPSVSEETCLIYEDVIEPTTIEPETESVTEEASTVIPTTTTLLTTELETEGITEDITTTDSILETTTTVATTTEIETETVTDETTSNMTTTTTEITTEEISTTQATTTSIPDQTTLSTDTEPDSTTDTEETTTIITTEYFTIETTTEFDNENVTDETIQSTTNSNVDLETSTISVTTDNTYSTDETTSESVIGTSESEVGTSENVVGTSESVVGTTESATEVTSEDSSTTQRPTNPVSTWTESFWNPVTIAGFTVLGVILISLLIYVLYLYCKRGNRTTGDKLISYPTHKPQHTPLPNVTKARLNDRRFGNNRSLMY